MGRLRPWQVRVGLVLLGAVICSLVLEQATMLTIWGFVDNPHDVQTIFHKVLVSFYGSILGGATVIAILLARRHFFKIAGLLTLFCSGIGIAWALWTLYNAEWAFDPSKQPFNDALAYCGPTLAFSLCLFIWGALLLGKRNKPVIQAQIIVTQFPN